MRADREGQRGARLRGRGTWGSSKGRGQFLVGTKVLAASEPPAPKVLPTAAKSKALASLQLA